MDNYEDISTVNYPDFIPSYQHNKNTFCLDWQSSVMKNDISECNSLHLEVIIAIGLENERKEFNLHGWMWSNAELLRSQNASIIRLWFAFLQTVQFVNCKSSIIPVKVTNNSELKA